MSSPKWVSWAITNNYKYLHCPVKNDGYIYFVINGQKYNVQADKDTLEASLNDMKLYFFSFYLRNSNI